MDGTIIYNGVHPQRRKLFNLNDRHNLQTNAELQWLSSLQYIPQDIKNHQSIGSARQKQPKRESNIYNRKLLGRYALDEFNLVDQNKSKILSSEKSRAYERGQEQTLNKQIDSFNSKYATIDNNSSSRFRQNSASSPMSKFQNSRRQNSLNKKSEDPQFVNAVQSYASYLKEFNLRSAFDKPEYISPTPTKKQKVFRNVFPDALENHLRKKSPF